MSSPVPRLLRFPNGRKLRPQDISRVTLFPERSPESMRPYLQVFTASGLFFEGVVDLDRVVLRDR